MRAASEQRDGNGHSVADGQANNSDTREGIESSSGAKVDETQQDLNSHGQHHGVEGDIELLVDSLPVFGARDGTITCKGPCAAGRRGGASNTAEQSENQEGDSERKCTSLAPNCGENDGWDGLAGRNGNQVCEIGEDEDKWDEEQETGDKVDDDGGDHGLGDLGAWLFDLLAHALRNCQKLRNYSWWIGAGQGDTYEIIIPVEDVAYAAWRSPTQKAHPGGQPELGSKSVKTYAADCLPFLAMARTQTTMAMTPAKVQKIAKVCFWRWSA